MSRNGNSRCSMTKPSAFEQSRYSADPTPKGGLEKRSAEAWEEAYWKCIKRFPEMNEKYHRQQEEIARLYQIIKHLSEHIRTLDGFTDRHFSAIGGTLFLDFKGLQEK